MEFWSLFEAASMPIIQVLLISGLGVFMASGYCNHLLTPETRRSLNKIVFVVFTPSLIFSSLAETVTLQDMISWWFMVLNVGLTFLFGGILGWIAVKLLKPLPHLEGLIIATCASGNLGNLVLIIVPAVCNQKGSPFVSNRNICAARGLSYASFSMALGGFFIWTYTYQLIRSSAIKYKMLEAAEEEEGTREPNENLDSDRRSFLLDTDQEVHIVPSVIPSSKSEIDMENQLVSVSIVEKGIKSVWHKIMEVLHQIIEELFAPPTLAAIIGLVFGAVSWLKGLVIGEDAPLHVIQDSTKLLGDGTIPCITLILGGNLSRGLKTTKLKPSAVIGVLIVKYLLLPVIGIGVAKLAANLGLLPSDPLFQFVLMIQFTLPPAMNVGTMTQLFDVAQEECSVLFLWTYLVAAFALSIWCTVYMWILS